MEILDGRALSLEVRENLKGQVTDFVKSSGVTPCLAVVLVGDDPASQVYVGHKVKACTAAGIQSVERRLSSEVTQAELIQVVQELNQNPKVHGILVQLPLPAHINEFEVLENLDPKKDADGLCIENLGLLLEGHKRVAPCTPNGVIQLLKKHEIPMEGRHAVIVGRSQIVGKPMALLLLEQNATVTICHSRTKDLDKHLKQADIAIIAAGKPEFLGADNFSDGTVIVDVGIHRKDNGKLCGDVRFAELKDGARAITPVPGGVGPMTIAMLLENTLKLAEQQSK